MLIVEEQATIAGSLVFEETVAMTFDPRAIAQQIRNLIRMYSNPRLAALREYTSNAKDAHKAAGYKGAVEVTLPSALHPFLTIKDHGIGLSREEIKGFGQFGHSTKADSNDYIGGFGLGSKSGLAVSPQFTVRAVKNGKRNVAVVGRDEKNMPTLGFMPEQDTTDPNGVTIEIPSSTGHSDWVGIAEGDTFIGWEPGSIVINGKEPAVSVHNPDQFTPLAGGWLVKDRPQHIPYWGAVKIKALVHGVFYDIPGDKFSARGATRILAGSVLSIDNGSVDILPSRDDLEWTDRTTAAVNAVANELVRSIVAEYQRNILSAKTFREAKKIEESMAQIDLPTAGLTWSGIQLDWSRGLEYAFTVGTAKMSSTAKSGWQTERVGKTTRGIQDVHKQHSVLVLGCTGETKISAYKRDTKFVLESGETTPYIIAEAEAAGVDVRDVVVYFSTASDTAGMHPGFVKAFSKQINLGTFAAQAVAQRKVWAENRAAARKSGAPVVAAGPVDRSLRVVREMRTYEQSFTTDERLESTLIGQPDTFVLIHAGDALANQVLEGHVNGAYTDKIKSVMKLIGDEATTTTFVLLARNQKADNLTAKNWVNLTDWLKTRLATVKVRTPMQVAVEQYTARKTYYRRVPKLTSTEIATINDQSARDFFTAYANPIRDGFLGEVSVAFPSMAVTQPDALDYDVEALYPVLSLIGDSVQRGQGQAVADYINLVDSTR